MFHFTKMQGLGNDYLYVYAAPPKNIKQLSIRLSDRHFGAGSDGMVFIEPSDIADFKMRIFNADGSEAKMCGNGIRCVGKYLYEKNYTNQSHLAIETLSGIKKLDLHVKNDIVESVSVDMGIVTISPLETIVLDGHAYDYVPVNVGNPHAVIFLDDVESIDIATIGPLIEHNFIDGINVEFTEIKQDNHIRMRVWERGSGITMACGTGACAAASAAVQLGYCSFNQPITIQLDGGDLEIKVETNYRVNMKGPAEFVFEGEAYEA